MPKPCSTTGSRVRQRGTLAGKDRPVSNDDPSCGSSLDSGLEMLARLRIRNQRRTPRGRRARRKSDAARGLIIDVRVSTGGHNPLGLQVASRITRRPYVAYGVEARGPEAEQYSDRQSAWIHPHRGPVYTGPVVLLTSRYTVSAHETFTQALLGRTPEVIRVGENTQGAISDHMFRSLPNGWIFSLPTQRFFSQGVAFDGAGVPPTVRVPVLTPEELKRGEDAAFDRAVALLTARQQH
jgi:C-terminal processing protease CtpA/Prc